METAAAPQGSGWDALEAGEVVGSLRTFVRPDGRCFIFLRSCRRDAVGPLVERAATELPRDLYVMADEDDHEALARFETLGFEPVRRESRYTIPTDPERTGLRAAPIPGFTFVRADDVDEPDLRRLDDALRQHVPGTDGWRWDEASFHEELLDPAFDPETYLVAVDDATGAHAGLVRVWNNPQGPRLGLIAVFPQHRRGGLASSLLAQAFAVLAARGHTEVVTEADDENVASTTLIRRLGGTRTGGFVELRRPRDGAASRGR